MLIATCVSIVVLSLTGKAEDSKEQNEVSGSKGEANFVWRCKTCKVGHRVNQMYPKLLTWD